MPFVKRLEHTISPDMSRIVARPFLPGESNFGGEPSRLDAMAKRIIDLPHGERRQLLAEARRYAGSRFRDIDEIWLRHFDIAAAQSDTFSSVSDPDLRLLAGAFVTQAYAYEGAALTNPSIVKVGKTNADGSIRFVMSARAIGEGHISSIAFISGRIGASAEVTIDERSPYSVSGGRRTPNYHRQAFASKLAELDADNDVARRVLAGLGDRFIASELDTAIDRVTQGDIDLTMAGETLKRIRWLASSNYVVQFDTSHISERVIIPAGPADSRGIEDARFVRFREDDGTIRYYATYTAFDGTEILPQLIETKDFRRFRISTLSGPMARQKGIALFPRRVGGLFMALSRHDQESTFVMRSQSLREWRNAELAFRPEEGWDAVQGGNCGSPIETDQGWLVITHGVGPMRRYALGAVLLDLDEPSKVVGRLREPLLQPEGEETIGYVPNVLYSCGSTIHNGRLILPYGFGDRGIKFATAPVDELLAAME